MKLIRTVIVQREFPVDLWQRYASPVWMDIRPNRTLQKESARDEQDERHICPLQLDVIERAVHLWSAPGDTVYSPFAGIGSEGYVALSQGRKFVGAELKQSYFDLASRNLSCAEKEGFAPTLFDFDAMADGDQIDSPFVQPGAAPARELEVAA